MEIQDVCDETISTFISNAIRYVSRNNSEDDPINSEDDPEMFLFSSVSENSEDDPDLLLSLSIVSYFINPDVLFPNMINVDIKNLNDEDALKNKTDVIRILTPYTYSEKPDLLFDLLSKFMRNITAFEVEETKLLCVYNHFKHYLNKYLDLLININISFNKVNELLDFDTFEPVILFESLEEDNGSREAYNGSRQEESEFSKKRNTEYDDEDEDSDDGENVLVKKTRANNSGAVAPILVEEQIHNPLNNQMQDIYNLLLNKIGDRLHYVMNSSRNNYLLKLGSEPENMTPIDRGMEEEVVAGEEEMKEEVVAGVEEGKEEMKEEDEAGEEEADKPLIFMFGLSDRENAMIRETLFQTAATGQFKKLFYTILTYLNKGFTFDDLNQTQPQFDYESFYYAYLILSHKYPGYIDNLETFDYLIETNSNKPNRLFDVNFKQILNFNEIKETLKNILQGNLIPFLSQILVDNLRLMETELKETINKLHHVSNPPPSKKINTGTGTGPKNPIFSIVPPSSPISMANFPSSPAVSYVPSRAPILLKHRDLDFRFYNNDNSIPVELKRKRSQEAGGLKGGNCIRILINVMVDLLRAKFKLEASHDLDSARGIEAVLGTENIFSVVGVNGKSENLYAKIYSTFETIVTSIFQISYAATDKLEATFLTDFTNATTTMDEPTYLSIIIDSIMLHCPERVDDFFYKPVIGFVLRDVENNKPLYELLREKVKTYYPYDKWYLFMKVKVKDGKRDLYLSVMKKPDRVFNNTSLGLYQQDMGLSNNLDLTLQEDLYFRAYTTIFPDAVLGNNIDNFFDLPNYTLKTDYTNGLDIGTQKLESGIISYTNKIQIDGSIQIIDMPKLFDPLSKETPDYGLIFMLVNNRITKLYLGYPNTMPIDVNGNVIAGAAQTSLALFNSNVDIQYPSNPANDQIRARLKDLNEESVQATIDAINTLLSVWIDKKSADGNTFNIVDSYQFILENNKIIGIKFASSENPGFTYTVHVGDLTVKNICFTIITHFKQNPGVNEARIIDQMIRIQRHDDYRYKGEINNINNINYQLAIIASFKSFGDEGQRIAAEKMKCWLLSSDRPLIAQGLLNGQPVIADLKIPHTAFGAIEDIPSGKIAGIYNENGGLLSNRRSLISVTKSTLELLQEALDELRGTNDLLMAKLGNIDIYGEPVPVADIMDEDTPDSVSVPVADIMDEGDSPPVPARQNIYKQEETELDGLIRALQAIQPQPPVILPEQENQNKDKLKKIREFIGEMKQILIGLEYYSSEGDTKKKTNKCIEYINSQIDYAIAISIDATTYSNLVAYNSNVGIHSRKNILDALRSMYDNIDFGPKLFECHSIACDELSKKINMYRDIVANSKILKPDAKELIKITYQELEEIIISLDETFTKSVKDQLEAKINASEMRPSREKKPTTFFGELVNEFDELQKQLKSVEEAIAQIENNFKEALKKVANFLTGKKKKTPEEREMNARKAELDKEKKVLEEKVRKKTQENASKVHTKDTTNAKNFLNAIKQKVTTSMAKKAQKVGQQISGVFTFGKNTGGKRTRKNKQKNQKKYTKREKNMNKKVSKTKRQIKNKMHKNTRKNKYKI